MEPSDLDSEEPPRSPKIETANTRNSPTRPNRRLIELTKVDLE